MKRICILLTILHAGCKTGVQEIRLHGSLSELDMAEVEMKYDGYTAEVFGDRDITIIPNSDGMFDTIIRITGSSYFKLGRNMIYVTPGDDLEISIGRQASAASFAGTGSEAAGYLKGIDWMSNNKLGISWGQRLPFDILLHKVDSLAAIRHTDLDGLKNVTDQFRKMEQARMVADIVNAYFGNIYSGEYYKWDDPNDVKERKKVEYYKSIFTEIEPLLHRIDNNDSLLNVSSVRKVLLDCYSAGLGINVSPLLKELAQVIEVSTEMDNGITRANHDRFAKYSATISDRPLQAAYEAKLVERVKLMEGSPARDIELRDLDGNVSRLSDHKGEVLYIDIWATWCLPCLAQTPSFNELSEKYPQVKFIAVSIDQKENAWRKKMESDKDQGNIIEYIADAFEVGYAWNVKSIPRFLLIDKDFNIVTAFAPRPSNKECIEPILNALINR